MPKIKVILTRTIRVETEVEFSGTPQQLRAYYRHRLDDLIHTGNVVSDQNAIIEVRDPRR